MQMNNGFFRGARTINRVIASVICIVCIVRAIREMGFEVYLAVDEFSWSKKPQPHLLRRQIINMSVAGDFHVYLFPNDIPVNIANPADLKRLREIFGGQRLYLVVGADVVAGASAYRKEPEPFPDPGSRSHPLLDLRHHSRALMIRSSMAAQPMAFA